MRKYFLQAVTSTMSFSGKSRDPQRALLDSTTTNRHRQLYHDNTRFLSLVYCCEGNMRISFRELSVINLTNVRDRKSAIYSHLILNWNQYASHLLKSYKSQARTSRKKSMFKYCKRHKGPGGCVQVHKELPQTCGQTIPNYHKSMKMMFQSWWLSLSYS